MYEIKLPPKIREEVDQLESDALDYMKHSFYMACVGIACIFAIMFAAGRSAWLALIGMLILQIYCFIKAGQYSEEGRLLRDEAANIRMQYYEGRDR